MKRMARPLEGHRILLECFAGTEGSRERCLRRVWQEYYPRLLVFVRAHGGSAAAEPEDTVQEVMEKIFRGIATYDPSWSFSTWAYAIARNACRDRNRRACRAEGVQSLSEIPPGLEPCSHRTPEQELLGSETRREVQEFFRGEKAEDRQVAFLRFHQRMQYSEIAAVMEMPVGTVKFRVHEMRRRLAARLEADHG
jgi:RNA polymerase sigma-70 factor (ECF subfamily)